MKGGENVLVEKDESKLGKCKYNRSKKVFGTWIVGLVERTATRRIILIPVLKRDKETLHIIIQKSLRLISIIITD